MEVRFRAPLDEPVFGFTLRHPAGHIVFATRTDVQEVPTDRYEAGDVAIVVPASTTGSRPAPTA